MTRWWVVDDIGSIVKGPFPTKADAERLGAPWGGERVMTTDEWRDEWYDEFPVEGAD